MPSLRVLATLAAIVLPSPSIAAQPIIAQSSGLTNPDHVIDFGANLFANFTNITTQFAGITVRHAAYFTIGASNNLVGGFLTNNFAGQPDTLSIRFGAPIHDLSFVYHQIGTAGPSTFRAVLRGTTVASFSNTSTQSQPNNYFGFRNVVFDELQLDFVVDFNVDTLAFNDVDATCAFRNGSGINPPDYTCTAPPVLGGNWQGTIATNVNTLATLIAFAPGGPHPGLPFRGGELLMQLTPAPIVLTVPSAFSLPVSAARAGLGAMLTTQGLRVDNVGATPTLVLLNALDLVLGV